MFTAERIVELVAEAIAEPQGPLRLYWLRVLDGNRDELAQAIQMNRGDSPIVPIVIRQPLFRDANTIPNDIFHLLAEAKASILMLRRDASNRGVALIVLARSEFGLPQVGSTRQRVE